MLRPVLLRSSTEYGNSTYGYTFDNNHCLPNFSHSARVPSPKHCSLLHMCPTPSQELPRLVPGEDGPMMKLLHQQHVGAIPQFPKPDAGILQSFQRLSG